MTEKQLEKLNQAANKVYPSLAALSKATGIPKQILSKAKNDNLAGFNANATVNLALARPALIEHYDDLAQATSKDKEYWAIENKKKDVELKELQIKKLAANMLDPAEVKSLLIDIATRQSAVIKRVFNELAPKISGKGEQECKVELDEAMTELFKVLKDKIDKWK
jgi:hypothetical protein